jgi:hypothetical protein
LKHESVKAQAKQHASQGPLNRRLSYTATLRRNSGDGGDLRPHHWVAGNRAPGDDQKITSIRCDIVMGESGMNGPVAKRPGKVANVALAGGH